MMKLLLFLLVLIVIVSIFFLTYSPFGIFNFAQGSDSDLSIVRSPQWLAAVISTGLLLCIAILLWYTKFRVTVLLMLIILISSWFLNGRIVGVRSDRQIIAGWFFVRTELVNFRKYDEDYEFYASHTQISPSLTWFIEITSHGNKSKMFIGPFQQKSVLKLMEDKKFTVTS